jgi:peptide/nickel transport system permease protein
MEEASVTFNFDEGEKNFKIYVRNIIEWILDNKSLTLGIFILTGIVLMAIFADYLAPYHFAERTDDCGPGYDECKYSPPTLQHPFGTNLLGYDMLSRIIYGSRIALQMSITSTILALSIGIPMGILSGYYGGKIDRLLNAIADGIYSFPSLLLAILIGITLAKYGNLGIMIAVSVSTAVVYIPVYFKIVRSQVLKEIQEQYIDAAKSMGASDLTIIVRYIFPNVIAAPIALIPFNMTEAILTNAALAFLGLSIQPPAADWGYDLNKNRSLASIRMRPWLMFFPALFIFLLSFSFALIGDSLNDKFNPLIGGREK